MTEWESLDRKSKQLQYDNEMPVNNIVKYFVHGIVFALFLPGFSFLIEIIIIPSVTLNNFTNLLLVFAFLIMLLPLLFGFLNGELARRLWNLNPRQSVTTWYGQGLLIFFMLSFFGGFYYSLLFLNAITLLTGAPIFILVLAVLILIDAIVSGYVGQHVAVEFEEAHEGVEELASIGDRHIVCPHCQSRFMRQQSNMDSDGLVSCPHCGGKVYGQPSGPQPTDSFDSFD